MTNHELAAERKRRNFTQEEMAKAMNVPVSTYRKWEQGKRKVPGMVDSALTGKKIEVKSLSTDEAIEFAKKTASEGLDPDDVVAGLIREWIGRTMAMVLLCFIAHQVIHPEDQIARRFGSRRKSEAAFEADADGEV